MRKVRRTSGRAGKETGDDVVVEVVNGECVREKAKVKATTRVQS